jgi:hypothetical protein
MKIKICVNNFGTSNLQYLDILLKEYRSFKKYKVDITVHTTVPLLNEKQVLYPESIREGLAYPSRTEMADAIDAFDVFIYTENDILITEDNIDALFEYNNTLPEHQIGGFLLYEQRNDQKIMVNVCEYYGPVCIKNCPTGFVTYNQHQASWVLTRKQLRRAIDSGGFLVGPHSGPYGVIEQGATDPYTQCGFEKVYPYDLKLLERLLARHLPLKYSVFDVFMKHGLPFK